MDNYTEPQDFVERVMKEVYRHEAQKREAMTDRQPRLENVNGWVISSGGLLFGLWNIARLLLTHFGPVVCR